MADYPTSAADDSTLHIAVNNKSTTLTAGIDASVTTIPVASTTGFPATGFISIDAEIIAYTSVDATNFLGATRAADGSAAAAHLNGTFSFHHEVAAHHNVLKDEVKAIETDLVAAYGQVGVATTMSTATEALARTLKYRRPSLAWGGTVDRVAILGNTAISGQVGVLFPDGDYRIGTANAEKHMILTQNAVLITSGHQGGLRATESEATNTWYACYAVKVTDSSTLFVHVGTTILPLQTNYTALNSSFGSDGWVYLGMARNGDNVSAGGDILKFYQTGNKTLFRNIVATSALGSGAGIRMANSASTTSLSYSYTAGIGATDIPDNLGLASWFATAQTGSAQVVEFRDSTLNTTLQYSPGVSGFIGLRAESYPGDGVTLVIGIASPAGICLSGFTDGILGVGSNPQL